MPSVLLLATGKRRPLAVESSFQVLRLLNRVKVTIVFETLVLIWRVVVAHNDTVLIFKVEVWYLGLACRVKGFID